MNIREMVRRMTARMRPFPPRHERRASIAAARASADVSRGQAEDAAAIGRDIKRIAYTENHFAQAIIDTLRERPPPRKPHAG